MKIWKSAVYSVLIIIIQMSYQYVNGRRINIEICQEKVLFVGIPLPWGIYETNCSIIPFSIIETGVILNILWWIIFLQVINRLYKKAQNKFNNQ